MSNEDKTKIYLFYLKSEQELYAFTGLKKHKELFLAQRNPDCFIVKSKKMTPLEYKLFSYKFSNLMLVDIPLASSQTEYVSIIATYKEDELLTAHANQLENELNELYRDTLKYNLKDKYNEAIHYMVTTCRQGKNDLESNINLVALFSKIFSNTFHIEKSE